MLNTLIKRLSHLRASFQIRAFRSALSSLDAAPQFAILGILSGLFTGLVILLFRVLVEQVLTWILPSGPDRLSNSQHWNGSCYPRQAPWF